MVGPQPPSAFLDLALPWFINRITMDEGQGGTTHIFIGRNEGRLPCPACGAQCQRDAQDASAQDERVWRHLDFGSARTYLHAFVPRIHCFEHGVQEFQVPWAQPHSRFTRFFEAQMVREFTTTTDVAASLAARNVTRDEARSFMERAIDRGMQANYQAALKRNPEDLKAHKGLAVLYHNHGDEVRSRHHSALAYRQQPFETFSYTGTGPAVPLLLLIPTIGGTVPWLRLVDDRIFRTTTLAVEYYDPAMSLPPHALIFNGIGDVDVSAQALEMAAALLARTAAPVINQPAGVRATSRQAVADRFRTTPGIATPHMARLPRLFLTRPQAVQALAANGICFPLLLRSPGFQTGHHFVQVERPEALAAAVETLPGPELLAIEYLNARGKDGLARKYRVMFIDGNLYPIHLAISEHWKVHYFSAGMTRNQVHQDEEATFLNHMPEVLGATAMAALAHIRDELALDYGGMDFCLDAQGNVVLFEANATMLISPPGPEPQWNYRRAAINHALRAAQAMLVSRAGGRPRG